MNRLLKYETRKLFRAKSFYICLAILAVYIFLSVLLQQAIYNALDESELQNTILPTAASILQSVLSGGLTTLILAIFTALFVCEDYTDGTLKNICAKGYGRREIYCSKFAAIIIFALLSCAVSWVCGYLFGAMYFEIGRINADIVFSLIAQVIIITGYAAMYFAVSVAIRKTGGAIAGCIVAPMLVSLVLSIVDSFFSFDSFSFADYWLEGLFSSVSSAADNVVIAVVLSLIYGIIFLSAGVMINKKQEI